MAKRLKDNITSDYVTASNRLNGRKARRRIVAYVEAYDDVFFWRMVLARYENEHRYFEVMLPTRKKLSRGKKSVLTSLLLHGTGKDMLACVDADYDYLLQGRTEDSKQVCDNPYVLHTYVYAIENYQCYGPSLHDMCVSVTLNDRKTFDFDAFLRRYSQIIYPLFLWNIFFYRRRKNNLFTIADFNNVVALGAFSTGKASVLLDNLQRKVNRKLAALRKGNPGTKEKLGELSRDLCRLGVTPETTYLYIQGHHLFDGVVVPMMQKVCDQLIRSRENEINRLAVHNTQRLNELSCYDHSTVDIVPTLRRNMGFMQSEPYCRLLSDVERCLKLGEVKTNPAKHEDTPAEVKPEPTKVETKPVEVKSEPTEVKPAEDKIPLVEAENEKEELGQ